MLIAIDGPIGVGKSTVANGLAAFRRSALLLERFQTHPFLESFYEDPIENALETEFAFLLLHYHQIKGASSAIGLSEVVSDFHLEKDLVYADLNLRNERIRSTFQDLFDICADKTPNPKLLILLSASDDLLIERIRLRNRAFEQNADAAYYSALNDAYKRYPFKRADRVISILMDEWDFIQHPELFSDLSHMVERELKTSA